MQRVGGPSLFPRLPASTRLWKCQTRYTHRKKLWQPRPGEPLRRVFPTFDISNLLLDLDAEGVKGVRAFDSQLDGEPEPSSAQKACELQPIKERVADFEKKYDECEYNFNSISADKFHPLHISDFDILAATLLDSSNTPKMAPGASIHNKPVSYTDMLDSVLDQNGVPRIARDQTSNTITYMQFRRRSLAHSLSLAPEDEELLTVAFNGHMSFSKIDRLVARAIQTPEGCRILSEVSDKLYESLIVAQEVEPIQLLSLLNNMLINLDRYGLHMSNKLYELGIWTSLKCHAIVTAQQYIEKRVKHGDYDNDFIDSILINILETSIASAPLNFHGSQLNVSSRLGALFSLLTGYVPGEGQSVFSLRSLVNRERPHGFRLYIQCLARLGAFRTIWHEWHQIDYASSGGNIDVRQDSAFNENSYFVTAILNSLAKNNDIAGLATSSEFTNVTGQFREDCQIDILVISRSARALALPDRRVKNSNPTPIYAKNWEKLYQIFKEKQMKKAFLALQAFLMSKTSFS
ncbi:hypothetical protein E0Z10_g2647 [Xylaria hypoxylon]|uniref:Uncharacterized protein n=1 Tax=Xylaria hypoxylon TaxID=37992 RepID=A0A4Z0YQH2_9PEZI|nr:hypothetical protein E0Z10_g2647 [Xylaria hypoxylon]